MIRDPGRPDATIGQLIPLLTLVSLPMTRQHRRAMVVARVGVGLLILALGPYWPGTDIPLPYQLVHKLMGSNTARPCDSQHPLPLR